jgi:hypothetical protein
MKQLLIILCLFPTLIFAQSERLANYDWGKKIDVYTFSEDDLTKDEVILFEKTIVEFAQVENTLKKFELVHNLKRLNSDGSIEGNNKFYIPMNEDTKTLILKARVIKPNGDIKEVSEKDIQQAKDEEGNVKYNYFAFEGIEKGSYIEFLHLAEYYPEMTGSNITVQGYYPKRKVDVELLYPSYLEFQLLSVNGLEEFKKDESDSLVTKMYLSITDLAGLEDEDWSAYDANLKKVYYKLSKNISRNKGNFYTYTEVSKLIHEDMFAPLTKKEVKLVNSFITKNTKGATTNLEKVRMLENAMKKTIPTIDGNFEKDDNIEQILTKNITNEKGYTKLMLNFLREMNIPFELVMTSDRTEEPFLEEFQGYNFLHEYLIYIKEFDKYFSSNFISRLGYPPYQYTFNKGLFISEVKLNDYATAVGKVKYIKGIDFKESIDEINTVANFNADLTACTVELTRINIGYKAQSYQAIIDFLDEDQKTEMKEEFLKYLDADGTIENISFENDHTDDFGIKPFIGKATVNSSTFLERAGDKILLKAGLLIGPQAQMYNEKPRVQPVDSYYTRGYDRKIVINLPEGYEVKNLDDLNFSCKPDAKNNILGFESSYEIKGNQIIVTVKEWYNTVFFTVAEYPMYEKTMNAAADFNKVVLILQPK